MRLLLDIGNTTIAMALSGEQREITQIRRFPTLKAEGREYFLRELLCGIKDASLPKERIDSIVISSVVPEVNHHITKALEAIIGKTPHFFSVQDARSVMDIKVDCPETVGKDRIADALGALVCYGAPLIVLDMGTATTIGVVNERHCFTGGLIIPGVQTALSALSEKASQLPKISVDKPLHLIGRNTVECMQSGILYGNAAMIDGLIDRITDELGTTPRVIATGGMSRCIVPHCHHEIILDDDLQFKGLACCPIK